MLNFGITIDGVQEFSRSYNRIEQQLDDLRFVWPAASAEIYSIEREQFESEGAAGASGKWAPLSPVYKRWKEIHFPGEPILKLYHPLSESLFGPDAADSIFRPETSQLTIGSKTPYAIFHQRGTGRMPARPPFSFNEKQKRRIQKAIQVGLVQFIRRQGFNVQGTTHDLAA